MEKIYKKDDKIIVEIPLWQDSLDALGEVCGKISNLVGMIAGDDQGLAQVIDLGYKGSFDYGDFLVKTHLEREDFIKLCEKLGIVVFEYPICGTCKKVIYGSCTWKDGQELCWDCEKKI